MTQTIEIPEGFELKKVSDTEYKIAKKERVLPKTWKEFCELNPNIGGEYYITQESRIFAIDSAQIKRLNSDKILLTSKEKAEAVLALCQLIQLRDYYNDGWKPDWNDGGNKFTIDFIEGKLEKCLNIGYTKVLAFGTEELRDEFLNNFKDLIEKLKPLYE